MTTLADATTSSPDWSSTSLQSTWKQSVMEHSAALGEHGVRGVAAGDPPADDELRRIEKRRRTKEQDFSVGDHDAVAKRAGLQTRRASRRPRRARLRPRRARPHARRARLRARRARLRARRAKQFRWLILPRRTVERNELSRWEYGSTHERPSIAGRAHPGPSQAPSLPESRVDCRQPSHTSAHQPWSTWGRDRRSRPTKMLWPMRLGSLHTSGGST
jgi:hypothetical protein